MNKIIIICMACIATLSCKAQQIVDMSANNNIDDLRQNGTYYIKDVNNYLDAFTGTWKYEYNTNKEFKLTLAKVEMYHVFVDGFNINYYRDGLSFSYQLYENNILTYQSPLKEYAVGTAKDANNAFMTFLDYGRNGSPFNLYLVLEEFVDSNGNRENKLHFELSKWEAQNRYYEEHPNEPYFSVPNDILMTKM